MDLLQEAYKQVDIFVDVLRLFLYQSGNGFCIYQLEHRGIVLPDTHDIVRDRCGDAQDQRFSRDFTLMPDLVQAVRILVYFYDRIRIDPVNDPVRPLSDHLASVDRDAPVGPLHRHHLGKTGHVQDLIDFRGCIADPQAGVLFSKT